MARNEHGPLVSVPAKRYEMNGAEDALRIIKETNKPHLQELLLQFANGFTEPTYVWFGNRQLVVSTKELIDNTGGRPRERTCIIKEVPTKGDIEKADIERRKQEKIAALRIKLVQKVFETREGLKYDYENYLPYLEQAGVLDVTTKELFIRTSIHGAARQWGCFIFDRPHIPSGLVSVNALRIPCGLWCSEHFYPRQRSGEAVYQAIKDGADIDEIEQLCFKYQHVHKVTSTENRALMEFQKTHEDFTDWEPMYEACGIQLVKLVDTKGGYATKIEYEGKVVTVTDFFQIIHPLAA